MSALTVVMFAQKHGGMEAIPQLTELLNSGHLLREIASRLEVDAGYLSRLVNSMYEKKYILKEEYVTLVEELTQVRLANFRAQTREGHRVLSLTRGEAKEAIQG